MSNYIPGEQMEASIIEKFVEKITNGKKNMLGVFTKSFRRGDFSWI